jgi:hypothetical protein
MALDAKWKQTVDGGLTDKAWDQYDLLIQTEVRAYNGRFLSTPNYPSLNWQLMKAVVWVESGGPKAQAWKTRPMQIGNPGDPGAATLKSGAEGSSLIMRPELWQDIKTKSLDDPQLNIRAGIAYLLTRLVTVGKESLPDAHDFAEHEYKVAQGDSFWTIARKLGTTVETVRKFNPSVSPQHLRPGQIIKYRKAKMTDVIEGWKQFTTNNIATYYNVGDSSYAEKLNYVLDLFKKLKR